MISPSELDRLVAHLVGLFTNVEEAVVSAVARRIRAHLKADDWDRARAGGAAELRREVRNLLHNVRGRTADEVESLIEDAFRLGVLQGVVELGGPGQDATAPPFETGPSTAAMSALAEELAGNLSETLPQILRSAEDVYRQTVAAVLREGLAGDYTRRTAAKAILDRFAMRGVTGFTDKLGRNWNLASYTEMATRTGTLNALREGKAQTLLARGHDLVRISDAPGECERCRPWEGKVVSLTGETKGYPTMAEARAAGLFHRNCRHTFGLYVEGLSKPAPRNLADPAGEAARSQQRYLERGVRAWKLRESVAFGPVEKHLARAKWKEWQARLTEHIEATGGKRLTYRESTPKTGRAI